MLSAISLQLHSIAFALFSDSTTLQCSVKKPWRHILLSVHTVLLSLIKHMIACTCKLEHMLTAQQQIDLNRTALI